MAGSVGATLGPSHPLVETTEALTETRRQELVVGGILVAGLVPAWVGVTWAQPAALSAAVLLCVLATAELNLRRRTRRQAFELILDGREEIPVAAVEDERRRLFDPRVRDALAASYESLADDAVSPASWPAASVFQRSTIASVMEEMHEVGSLLRSGPSSARGVALARTLLTNVTRSPLHRGDVDALRHELRRIRFLLESPRG
jgi:hypothetical protein